MERTGLTIIICASLVLTVSSHWALISHGARREAQEQSVAKALPKPNTDQHYISSDRCQSCHPNEHSTWHRTYHRTMTQAALPGNILGRFDGSEIVSNGLTYRVYQEGDTYMAEMPDPDEMMYVFQGNKPLRPKDIPRRQLPVVMSTGSHHYQTYWVASPKHPGILQTLPLVYLLSDQRWIPREEAFMRNPNDRNRLITQWNHHCIRCHSTGGNPGLDDETGLLNSKVGELGIACESCHGPGQAHAEFYQNPLNRYRQHGKPAASAYIINPEKLDHKASSETCGQCHGIYIMEDEYAMTYAREGSLYRPGEDLHKTRYYIQHPANDTTSGRAEDLRRNPTFFQERWWDDGTILAGGREYTAMSVSKCFTHGTMSCLSCHAMHNSPPADQLKSGMDTSHACIQCHQEPRFTTEIARHTFHEPGSSGSNCLNCHMPRTTYALFGAIRSHQIESPSIINSARFGVPNACNLCHLDKSLGWAQNHLKDRYDQPTTTLTREQETISAALLWLLKGHAAQRVIAAWHMAWPPAREASGDQWQAPFQAQLLDDPYGVVRYVAGSRLQELPEFDNFQYDFLATPKERQNARDQAVAHWEQSSQHASKSPTSTLQASDGALRRKILARFLSEQDDRPITIKE